MYQQHNEHMIYFPNAKINIGLNVTEKRPDGYHNLETVFYPIELQDAIEIDGELKGSSRGVLREFNCALRGMYLKDPLKTTWW